MSPAKRVVRRERRATAVRSPRGRPASLPLATRAYDAIKLKVITLEYRPGTYLNEAQICGDLDLGRTPVHEAVSRLALEGMLEVMPRKGVLVRPVSLDEVMANIEARLIVEPQCLRLATERATADELAQLAALLDAARGVLARRDVNGLMQADRQFHAAITRAARNPVLESILQQLHDRSLRFWFISLSEGSHQLQVDTEHRAILRAMQARNPDAAERAIRAHIQSFRETIKRSL